MILDERILYIFLVSWASHAAIWMLLIIMVGQGEQWSPLSHTGQDVSYNMCWNWDTREVGYIIYLSCSWKNILWRAISKQPRFAFFTARISLHFLSYLLLYTGDVTVSSCRHMCVCLWVRGHHIEATDLHSITLKKLM